MAKRERKIPEEFKNRKIYSFSRLSTFDNCKHEYLLSYISRAKRKDNIYSVVGGLAHDINEQLQNGEITNEKALEMFDDGLLDCEIQDIKFMSDNVKKNYVECVKDYFKNFTAIPGNVVLEKEIYYEVDGIVFVLYPDAIVENEDGSVSIVDYKTSSEYKGDALDEHALQLLLYAYIVEQKFKKKVKDVKWNMFKYYNVEFGGKSRLIQRNILAEKCKANIKKSLKDIKKYDQKYIDEMIALATEKDDVDILPDDVAVSVKIANRKVFNKKGESDKNIEKIKKAFSKVKKYNEFEIEDIVGDCIKNNNLDVLPVEAKEQFKIDEGWVVYPYNQTQADRMLKWIREMVDGINDELEWEPCDISKQNFYCNTLCSVSKSCEPYKKYLEENKKKWERKNVAINNDDEIDDLFS